MKCKVYGTVVRSAMMYGWETGELHTRQEAEPQLNIFRCFTGSEWIGREEKRSDQ